MLQGAGALLVVVGAIHLAITPHLMRWLSHNLTARAYAETGPASMLNHVVVGVLLIPLGLTTAFAAGPAQEGARWAFAVELVNALAVLAMPATLFFTVTGPMLRAPAFVVAMALLAVASVALLVAVFALRPRTASPA